MAIELIPTRAAEQLDRFKGVTEHVLQAYQVVTLAHTAPLLSPGPDPGNAGSGP